jgi:hypothetical protein
MGSIQVADRNSASVAIKRKPSAAAPVWVGGLYLCVAANLCGGGLLPGLECGPCGPSSGDMGRVGYRVRFYAVVMCIFE